MATIYLPRVPSVFRAHCQPSPWLSPYRLPGTRRRNLTRYVAGKTKDASAFERPELHVHVDASGTGLGMSLQPEGKWQRWIFNNTSKLLHQSPNTNRIDSNWAELLAIYLALHTLVKSGHHASQIVLHSDSASVVGILQKHLSVQPSLWGVVGKGNDRQRDLLKKIGELVEKHGIGIKVQWVSTKKNLADGASRGKGLVEEKRLNHGADVPEDIIGIVDRA